MAARQGSPIKVLGAFAFGGALLCACKHTPPPASEVTSDAALPVVRAAASVDAGFAEARCTLVAGADGAFTLDEVGDPRALEVGEGAKTADGVAVGIVHAPASGPEAIVARASRSDGRTTVKNWVLARHGELVSDAPPPKPLVAGGALYAAYIARVAADGGKASRRIVLRKEGLAAPIATYPDHTNESLAFDASLTLDASRAAVVWDDDVASGADKTGGITIGIAPLGGGEPLAPRVISGENADPEGPRLVAREGGQGGWWVAWMAHRLEPSTDAGAHTASVAIEAPAEDRVFTWIEVVAIGNDGTPMASPRRITSASGRAASFDLAPRPNGGLDVVVRDEIQIREGEGGRILQVAVLPDARAEEPVVVVSAGVGRGAIDLVTSPGGKAWLAYSDAQDRVLLAPLAQEGLAGGTALRPSAASVEAVLEGGRILTVANGASSATPAAASRFTAAFPGAAGALFREVACAP